MIEQRDIRHRIVDGRDLTYIAIGGAEGSLPRYMLQGEKEPGYIVRDGKAEPWYWEGFSEQDGVRYVYFSKLDIVPATSLATTLRSRALPLVRDLARALMALPKDFIRPTNGIMPLWRVYFLAEGGVLVFPEFLSEIFAATGDDSDRFDSIGGWIRPGLEASFTLCDQMTQLLYFAATGMAPYKGQAVRETRFRPLPLALAAQALAPQLDPTTAQWIDAAMRISNYDQKKATENLPPEQGLGWWLAQTDALAWSLPDLPSRDEQGNAEKLSGDAQCAAFLEKQDQKARRNIFWRKKGWIVIASVVAFAAVASFAGSQIKTALAPPYTAGMDPVQVIEEYYVGQSELDIQKLEASLAGRAKSPVSMEVSNLFVTRQMRLAYEGINTVIPAPQWNAEGRPDIPDYAYIYGVDDVRVHQTGDDTWTAVSTLYSPYDYEAKASETEAAAGTETSEQPVTSKMIYLYEQTQEFTLQWNKRGWWEIVRIGDLHYTPAGTLTVGVVAGSRPTLGGAAASSMQ